MKAYCENCESFQPADFRLTLNLADSRPYEDLCCKSCNYVIATVEDRPSQMATIDDALKGE